MTGSKNNKIQREERVRRGVIKRQGSRRKDKEKWITRKGESENTSKNREWETQKIRQNRNKRILFFEEKRKNVGKLSTHHKCRIYLNNKRMEKKLNFEELKWKG